MYSVYRVLQISYTEEEKVNKPHSITIDYDSFYSGTSASYVYSLFEVSLMNTHQSFKGPG